MIPAEILSTISFPVDNRVQDLVFRVHEVSTKADSNHLQAIFLRKLKTHNLLPKHLSTLKLPSLFDISPFSDVSGPLKDIDPALTKSLLKHQRRYYRRIKEMQFFILTSEIAHKELQHSAHLIKLKNLKSELRSIITTRQFNTITYRLNVLRKRYQDELKQRHNKKFDTAKRRADPAPIQTPAQPPFAFQPANYACHGTTSVSPQANNPNIDSHLSSTPDNLMLVSPSSIPPDSGDLLNRSSKFMLSPSNQATLVHNTKLGVNRTICAIRYEAAAAVTVPSTDASQSHLPTGPCLAPASLRTAASTFEHVNIQPPRTANQTTEIKIKTFRSSFDRIINNRNTWSWNQNHSKKQLSSLKSTLSDPETALVLTDKTNKVCAMPSNLLATKLHDHVMMAGYLSQRTPQL